MLSPLFDLGALAITFLNIAASPSLDPGPSAECPADMRLVTGQHHDEMEHLCIDPKTDAKTTHCFAYFEGASAEEGAVTARFDYLRSKAQIEALIGRTL